MYFLMNPNSKREGGFEGEQLPGMRFTPDRRTMTRVWMG